jgi:WD40 repeat protein
VYDKLDYSGYDMIDTECGGIQSLHLYGNSLICSGWNKKMCIVGGGKVEDYVDLEYKAYCSDILANQVILGLSSGKIRIYDLRNTSSSLVEETFGESTMIRSVKFMNEFSYAIGTTSGKVRIENLRDGNKSIGFSLHKMKGGNGLLFYPVSCLGMDGDGNLVSSGYDGKVVSWCVEEKRKVREWFRKDTPVSWFDIKDGRMVIGVSEMWEGGEMKKGRSELYFI